MIKKLMIFTLFSISSLGLSFNSYSFNEAKDRAVKELLTSIEVDTFIGQIEKIKKYKTLDEIDSLDYELRYFFKNIKLWYYFDQVNFKRGLEQKLKLVFSETELRQIKKSFKKPFLLKVLNSTILYRNIFSFNENSISGDYKSRSLVKSRYTLIKNIYKLNGMELQTEEFKKRLSSIIESGKVVVRVLKSNKTEDIFVSAQELKMRLNTPEKFMIEYLAMNLKSFRHYELREYIRNFKNKSVVKKFLNLYANYHFIYMARYIQKVEEDKLNQLKTINTKI